jgi:hypothetical protein
MLSNQLNDFHIQQPEIRPVVPGTANPPEIPSKELNDVEEEPEPELVGDGIASEEEVLAALEEMYTDKNIHVKLISIAKKSIYERMGKKGFERITPDELVSESINRIINGKRKWNKAERPDIFELIIMVIVSIARAEANKNINPEDPLFSEIEAGIKPTRKNFKPKLVPLEFRTEKSRFNENTVADVETARHNYNIYNDDKDAIRLDDCIDKVELALSDDEEAFFVFMQRLEGVNEPKLIAENLKIDVTQVYNALKRIKRVILSITNTN